MRPSLPDGGWTLTSTCLRCSKESWVPQTSRRTAWAPRGAPHGGRRKSRRPGKMAARRPSAQGRVSAARVDDLCLSRAPSALAPRSRIPGAVDPGRGAPGHWSPSDPGFPSGLRLPTPPPAASRGRRRSVAPKPPLVTHCRLRRRPGRSAALSLSRAIAPRLAVDAAQSQIRETEHYHYAWTVMELCAHNDIEGSARGLPARRDQSRTAQ